MKKNIINMKFKVKDSEPSDLRFGGNESENTEFSDLEICATVMQGVATTPGMEWIILDVEEADGFSYRIRTTFSDGNAVTEFGVPEECYKSDKLKDRLAQFKEIFENNGISTSMIH